MGGSDIRDGKLGSGAGGNRKREVLLGKKGEYSAAVLPGTVSQTAEIIAEILHTVSFGGRSEEVSWRSAESPVERVRG